MGLIRLDNFSDQRRADNIALRKCNEPDIFQPAQDILDLNQSASGGIGGTAADASQIRPATAQSWQFGPTGSNSIRSAGW